MLESTQGQKTRIYVNSWKERTRRQVTRTYDIITKLHENVIKRNSQEEKERFEKLTLKIQTSRASKVKTWRGGVE